MRLREMIILFMFFLTTCEAQNNICSFNEGLYYGKKGTAHIYITNKNDTAIAEVFVIIKGYVMNPLIDTLYKNKNSTNEIFIGKESIIFIKRNTYHIRQKTGIITPFKYRERQIDFKPCRQKELNEYRNRAYIYKDRDKIRELFTSYLPDTATTRAINYFYNSLYKHSVETLARTLQHKEFIEQYLLIREKTIQEIFKNKQ